MILDLWFWENLYNTQINYSDIFCLLEVKNKYAWKTRCTGIPEFCPEQEYKNCLELLLEIIVSMNILKDFLGHNDTYFATFNTS